MSGKARERRLPSLTGFAECGVRMVWSNRVGVGVGVGVCLYAQLETFGRDLILMRCLVQEAGQILASGRDLIEDPGTRRERQPSDDSRSFLYCSHSWNSY
jgi:hypothetical protein